VNLDNFKKLFESGKPVIIEYTGKYFGVFPGDNIDFETFKYLISVFGIDFHFVYPEYKLNEKGFYRMPSNGSSVNGYIPVTYSIYDDVPDSRLLFKTLEAINNNFSVNVFKFPGYLNLVGSKPLNNSKTVFDYAAEFVRLCGMGNSSLVFPLINESGFTDDYENVKKVIRKEKLKLILSSAIETQNHIENTYIFKNSETSLKFDSMDIIGFKSVMDKKEYFVLKKGNLSEKNVHFSVYMKSLFEEMVFYNNEFDKTLFSEIINKMNEYENYFIILAGQENKNNGLNNLIKSIALRKYNISVRDSYEVIGLKEDNTDIMPVYHIIKALGVSGPVYHDYEGIKNKIKEFAKMDLNIVIE